MVTCPGSQSSGLPSLPSGSHTGQAGAFLGILALVPPGSMMLTEQGRVWRASLGTLQGQPETGGGASAGQQVPQATVAGQQVTC